MPKEFAAPDHADIEQAITALYMSNVIAHEASTEFKAFGGPSKTTAEFKCAPMVLLIGQYSVGKTSFIRWMLGKDFPGMLIGPEPTTETFTALMPTSEGVSDRNVPGSTACADEDKPFSSLKDFGSHFTSKFSISMVSEAKVLEDVIMIDTPGVLAGEKQTQRNYDFLGIVRWFAERADLILVLADAFKLDSSDEFMNVIRGIQEHDEKIRIVLNKADQVTTGELLRINAAMAWNFARVLRTPEVKRMYVSSFWSEPLANKDLVDFMEQERKYLLTDLAALKEGKLQRRINEFLRRVRKVYAHALVVEHIRNQIPMMSKAAFVTALPDQLPSMWPEIAKAAGIVMGELPAVEHYQQVIRSGTVNVLNFPSCAIAAAALKEVVDVHMPRVLKHFRCQMEGGKPDGASDIKGWLLKQGESGMVMSGSFKRRWCTLSAGVLTYYDSCTDADSTVKSKGSLAVAGTTNRSLPDAKESFSFCLEGAHLGRTFVWCAESAEQMSDWMKQLSAHSQQPPPKRGSYCEDNDKD